MRHRLSAVGGALAVLAGLLVLVWSDLAPSLSLGWALVVLVAIAAGVQSLRFVQERRKTPLQATETSDPEERYTAPTPGDDIDATLVRTGGWAFRDNRSRGQLRDRVHEAAVAAIVDTSGCDRGEAARRIQHGEWTDDRVAAWFLSESVTLTTRERLRLAVDSPGARFATGFGRAVQAVQRLTEGETA